MRARWLLRRLAELSRNGPRKRGTTPAHPVARAGRGVGVVLHRPDRDARASGQGIPADPPVAPRRLIGARRAPCRCQPRRSRALRRPLVLAGDASGWRDRVMSHDARRRRVPRFGRIFAKRRAGAGGACGDYRVRGVINLRHSRPYHTAGASRRRPHDHALRKRRGRRRADPAPQPLAGASVRVEHDLAAPQRCDSARRHRSPQLRPIGEADGRANRRP